MSRSSISSKMVLFLMIFPAFSGCMEDSVEDPLELEFSVAYLVGGEFQNLRIVSSDSMSVLVPYLMFNSECHMYINLKLELCLQVVVDQISPKHHLSHLSLESKFPQIRMKDTFFQCR